MASEMLVNPATERLCALLAWSERSRELSEARLHLEETCEEVTSQRQLDTLQDSLRALNQLNSRLQEQYAGLRHWLDCEASSQELAGIIECLPDGLVRTSVERAYHYRQSWEIAQAQ